MAVPGTIQALIAAFSFGILFNAASAALVIHIKGHGSAIYRDGLRLVLILFLLAASLWALVEFLATLIDPNATSMCQVAVVFSSLFDQLGRVFVEQYLVWAVPKGDTKAILSLVPQILVFGRLFVGIAFTAVTRTQFKPTCAPISNIRAVSITTIALDAVIIGLLSIQAFASGSKTLSSRSTTLRTGTVRLVVVGVTVWWGASVTSLLGLGTVDLFYRTALPGIGLTILVGLVTVLSQTLVVPREPPQRPDSPISREPRDLSSSDSAEYPPSRYEDLKVVNAVSISAFATKTEVSRSIRRNDDGTFPPISKPVAVGSDLNANSIQEQLFLATRPSVLAPALSAVPPLPENGGIIKNASGRIKIASRPKAKTGKLSISNPILNEDENAQNPLKRIPTIDLAKAASNDRLRREKYMQRIPSLVAQRPAPRPPSPPTAPETITTDPQDAEELGRSESVRTGKTSSGLSVEGNASSTATQLSPGADVVRRRSPRQPESFSSAAPFKVIRPGEPIRIPIPRPVERDQDSPPTKPEPVKTPLQRRPTTGLPSNPRAQTLKSSTEGASNQKTQTVMFVNDIVYNNPDAIGEIIQGAGKVLQPPDSGDSVVNRPRPIPRKGDKDRQVFPAEISPSHQHRRSKSGGSIVSRKSILQSVPGSPTGLPSLPPMPPMTRGAPNSAKSMTVEEKMSLLYSAPLSAPSSTAISTKRRSSVPDLPPIPIALQEYRKPPMDVVSDSESSHDIRASKDSKRTTARTSSLLGISVDSQSGSQSNGLATSFKDSNPVDELGNSWLPGIQFTSHGEGFTASGEVKRRSSPVLPTGRQLSMSTTQGEAQSGDEETITNWGSVYSPVAPVSRQNARSTYIRKGSRNVSSSEEIPIIMFDESLDGPLLDSEHSKSPFDDSDCSQHLSGQFHHRLGDDCPTFSARKDNPRPRKMPPPTPLLLNGMVNKRTMVKQPAIPSPVESPRAAYEVIQAQLRKFEQLDRDLAESPARRLALLANLEQEMGQLESEWQSNHEHLSRDSMSSIQISPQHSRRTSVAPSLSRPSSRRSSVSSAIAERRALRRARMQSGGGEQSLAPSSQHILQISENAQGVSRQTRLAEAHVKYLENAPELLVGSDDLNLVSTSKANLGSPNPPETNELHSHGESEEACRSSSLDGKQPIAPIHALWSHEANRESVESWLWEPKISVPKEWKQSCELPGISVRPAPRRQFDQLKIESSHLWQNKSTSTLLGQYEGLWNNHPSQRRESAKALRRPATMRPPRKNKRITVLPDIIENPEPLPNKRGTLGIFQFPWGEKSENATLQYHSRQSVMAMPGTMATGHPTVDPVIDSQLAQLEDTEYSSSFFDEYDEEGDNFSDFSGSGDDDFDETTLWEIASLLQTNQIPSKNSLMFMPSDLSSAEDTSALAEYVADTSFDDEYDDNVAAQISSPFRDTAAINEQNMSYVESWLWSPEHASQKHIQKFGLPQLETLDWNEHFGEVVRRIRSQPLANDLEPIRSTKMWSPMVKETKISKTSFLWAAPRNTSNYQEMSNSVQLVKTKNDTSGLWINSKTATNPYSFGLPEPDAQAWQGLILQTSVVSRSKSRLESSLPMISSSELWSLGKATKSVKLWTQPPLFLALEDNTLFNPKASRTVYRTTSKPPAALSLLKRAFRRNDSTLEPLTSTALWSSKGFASVEPSATGLWKPSSNTPQMATSKPMEKIAEIEISATGLWKQSIEVRKPEPLGLFDLKESRLDFRRTSKPPAALLAFAAPRLIRENASVLTSQNLWAPQLVQATGLKGEETGFLWQGKLPASSRAPALFRLDARRTDYRTTSANPAALVVVRRPRTIEQPLERLQSNQLWANDQVTHTKLDWIAMCTLHSTSLLPSPSATSPPLTSSIDVALVEASVSTVLTTSTPSKSKGSFFSSLFSKKKDKNPVTRNAPEVQLTMGASNLDLSQDIVIRDLDNIPHVKPAHTPLRHRYRRAFAYNANWEAALAEAITASYPGTMLALRASHPKDWDSQLHEATIAGNPPPEASRQQVTPQDKDIQKGEDLEILDFDATRQHPVFFGSMETSAETVHPALTGYRINAGPIESRIRHKDFSKITSAPSNTSYLWAKPVNPQATLGNGLWTIFSEKNSNFDLAFHEIQSNNRFSYYPTRRNDSASRSTSEVVTVFRKQGLWKRSNESRRPCHPSSLRKNWLEDTVNKRFTRIELRY
ncbi:hypothetical protein FHL15_006708 [Xylaria flabelliformis]|uniref:Uncharacterized protein n=1 Tax=Xylaria flabelliformis TaxID=2512241 RepID=A0A553HWJ0_9PEZI|nr:hypothetical protein FHL15_006708 [Xylaria flabelliformis]